MASDEKIPRRCPGVNADGSACSVPSELLLASGFCFPHDPARGLDRVAAATIAGIKSNATKRNGIDTQLLGSLETPQDAMRWTNRIALAVATGELSDTQGKARVAATELGRKGHTPHV